MLAVCEKYRWLPKVLGFSASCSSAACLEPRVEWAVG